MNFKVLFYEELEASFKRFRLILSHRKFPHPKSMVFFG